MMEKIDNQFNGNYDNLIRPYKGCADCIQSGQIQPSDGCEHIK